ncbi:hypothetical protein IWW39_006228, partial [Coemansia spiralis]
MTIVQRHLAKLDAEIRHFDKSPATGIEPKRSTYVAQPLAGVGGGTVGISNGELSSFRLPTPKRFSDSIPSLALENAVTEGDEFYTPSRIPKRRHGQQGGSNGVNRPVQRPKKQMKLANSVLSLDGIEV